MAIRDPPTAGGKDRDGDRGAADPGSTSAALALAETMRGLFQDALLALYLHGSAVAGGLRPQSDIDLIAVVDRPMTQRQREELLAHLLEVSGRHPAPPGGPRCVELTVFLRDDLAAPASQTRYEFLYGEWLRAGFEAGQIPGPATNPDIALVLAQARQQAVPLLGADAHTLLPEIPLERVRHAMVEALPALLDDLRGDERNVLLTLARMWRTAVTGEFVPKDAAAAWAAPRMPAREADVLLHARDAYLGRIADNWHERETVAQQTAAFLHRQVVNLL